MTLMLVGIVVGWFAYLVYASSQNQEKRTMNGGLVIGMLLVVLLVLSVGYNVATDPAHNGSATPTPTMQGR